MEQNKKTECELKLISIEQLLENLKSYKEFIDENLNPNIPIETYFLKKQLDEMTLLQIRRNYDNSTSNKNTVYYF